MLSFREWRRWLLTEVSAGESALQEPACKAVFGNLPCPSAAYSTAKFSRTALVEDGDINAPTLWNQQTAS